MSALEDTVNLGTAKTGAVSGYRVAGKTATGENGRGNDLVYLAGYAAIAPASSPQLVVVVNIYNAKGPLGSGGGAVSGPVVSSILEESLRYLDIPTDYTVEENSIEEKLVPSLVGKTVSEAKNLLSDQGLKIASDGTIADTDIIKDQIPKSSATLMEGSTVRVYTTDQLKQTISVPDVRNKTSAYAIKAIQAAGLNVRVEGKGTVVTQDPSHASIIEKGSIVTIKCADTSDLP
jgi:hypothetical protein